MLFVARRRPHGQVCRGRESDTSYHSELYSFFNPPARRNFSVEGQPGLVIRRHE